MDEGDLHGLPRGLSSSPKEGALTIWPPRLPCWRTNEWYFDLFLFSIILGLVSVVQRDRGGGT